ncbi:hypothetical protein QQ045_016095 [Rhodiola kirilowii]
MEEEEEEAIESNMNRINNLSELNQVGTKGPTKHNIFRSEIQKLQCSTAPKLLSVPFTDLRKRSGHPMLQTQREMCTGTMECIA